MQEAGTPVKFHTIDDALADIRQGKMVILVDDEERENEGALTMAAARVTPEAINFMATYGRGLICLSLTPERLAALRIPLMVKGREHGAPFGTAFTVSIEARRGVTTGISAADRATTILRLRTLATATASKALLRQIETIREEALLPSLLERLQTFPTFADAAAYFGAIAEALHPRLDAPPAARPRLPEEADAPARPESRRQRRATTPRPDDWRAHAPSASSQAHPSGHVRQKARIARVGKEGPMPM